MTIMKCHMDILNSAQRFGEIVTGRMGVGAASHDEEWDNSQIVPVIQGHRLVNSFIFIS